MKLSSEEIKEVAENLECGMICYIHKETKKIKPIIDFENNIYAEEAMWKDELDEIENNREHYLCIENMSSRESFRIMADFAEDEVPDKEVRNRLIGALNRKKPFQNFKYELGYHEEVRQQWFSYKTGRYIEWVKMQLGDPMEEDDDESPPTPVVSGYFDDDGNQINPNLHALPSLCLSCKKKDDPHEEIPCNLNRMDQVGADEFVCHAYRPLGS